MADTHSIERRSKVELKSTMNTDTTYKIRPAGRHLLTIGRDLIQDNYAAVVELVKNAYDADSPDVQLEFMMSPLHSGYTIVIADHGHGMSREDVVNKWMVPSTQDKIDRRKSPSGQDDAGKQRGRAICSIHSRYRFASRNCQRFRRKNYGVFCMERL